MFRVVARAAIAEPDVEIAVRSEREVSAVVIGERLRDDALRPVELQIESRGRIGDERIGRAREARDDGVAVWVREVDVEAAARRVIGREREAEQALLAAAISRCRSD